MKSEEVAKLWRENRVSIYEFAQALEAEYAKRLRAEFEDKLSVMTADMREAFLFMFDLAVEGMK